MRADVKLGVAVSAVLVSVVGGYFTFRGNGTPPAAPAGEANQAAIDPKNGKDAKDAKPATPAAQPNGKRVFPRPPTGADGKPQATTPPDPSQPNRRRVGSPVTPSTGQPTTPGATPGASNAVPSPAARSGSLTPPNTSPISGSANAPAATPTGSVSSPTPELKNANGSPEKATEPAVRPSGDGSAGTVPPSSSRNPGDAASIPTDTNGVSGGAATASKPTPGADAASPSANGSGEGAPSPSGSSVPSGAPRTLLSATAPAVNPVGSNPAARESSSAGALRNDRPTPTDRNAVATDTHRVQSGDTFASLAKNYYGSENYARFLKESNPQLGGSDTLLPGSIVRIPATPKEMVSESAATASKGAKLASPAAPATGASTGAAKQGGKTYQVRTGDSFYSIARSVLGDSKRWKELYEMNRKVVRDDPKSLRPGQVLTLPEK